MLSMAGGLAVLAAGSPGGGKGGGATFAFAGVAPFAALCGGGGGGIEGGADSSVVSVSVALGAASFFAAGAGAETLEPVLPAASFDLGVASSDFCVEELPVLAILPR